MRLKWCDAQHPNLLPLVLLRAVRAGHIAPHFALIRTAANPESC
jgi:hypothetical protein